MIPRTIKNISNTVSFPDSDSGASINVMPLSTLKKVGIPKEWIVKSLIGIMGFQGDKQKSLGYVIVDLVVAPIRTATKFHIIDAQTNYHMIAGHSWMHRCTVIPSSYHQCLKGVWSRKKVTVAASKKPFEVHEAHLSDVVYFTELEEIASTVVSKPRGVKITKWEDIKNDDDDEASSSKRYLPAAIVLDQER